MADVNPSTTEGSNEMVERVAQRLCAMDDGRLDNPESLWDALNEVHRDEYREEARGAIQAMCEPTKTMILAGDDAKDDCIDEGYDSDVDGNRHDYTIIRSDISARIWSAMIIAALIEPNK